MTFVAIDFETHLFSPGDMAPRPVCLTYCNDSDAQRKPGILQCWDRPNGTNPAFEYLWHLFAETTDSIVGHNLAFDTSVACERWPSLAPMIWQAYEDDRCIDTGLAQRLIDYYLDARRRSYSLGALCETHLGVKLDKAEDGWRMRYAELDGVPVDQWPERATKYALEDARNTLLLLENLLGQASEIGYRLPTLPKETTWDFCLRQASNRGLVVDSKRASDFLEYCQKEQDRFRLKLFEAGVIRFKRKGDQRLYEAGAKFGFFKQDAFSKNTKWVRDQIENTLGVDADRTATGLIAANKRALEKCKARSSAEWFDDHLQYDGVTKVINTYAVKLATNALIHPGFNVIGARSSRVSSFKPNIQNQPRKKGIRESFTARAGYCLVACDYDAQEMRTLAQACVNLGLKSKLAASFQGDTNFDPHTDFASTVMGVDYQQGLKLKASGDKELKNNRQRMKAANFGFLGGMGARKFSIYAQGYGLNLSVLECQRLREQWLDQWPEMVGFFNHVRFETSPSLFGAAMGGMYESPLGFVRGNCRYTQFANSHFQCLAAHVTKTAAQKVTRQRMLKKGPLANSYLVCQIHDELILEIPLDELTEAAAELERLMIEAQEEFTPDVPAAATAAAMTHWSKDAETLRDDSGNLVVWQCPDPMANK